MDENQHKKHVEFDFECSNSERKYIIEVGHELYKKGMLQEQGLLNNNLLPLSEPPTNLTNNIGNFKWNNTHIQNISDQHTRDLCIVMFQSITWLQLWENLGNNTPKEIKNILNTMRNFGYVGELEGFKMNDAIQMMKDIKKIKSYK